MKRTIQIVLFFTLILLIVIFYINFLQINEKDKELKQTNLIEKTSNLNLSQEKGDGNNLIKNLRYEVKIDKKYEYILLAAEGNIEYENGFEYIKMQNVNATIWDQNNMPLVITSNNANFNNSNYDTKFINEVKIKYMNNLIDADIMELIIKDRKVKIYKNVKYTSPQNDLIADNIVIDLVNNKIDIFMNDENEKVKIITNQ